MELVKANYHLTDEELQILQLFANGIDSESICDQLEIDEESLHTHLKNLYAKFRVKNVNEAVAAGVRNKLVTCRFIPYGD